MSQPKVMDEAFVTLATNTSYAMGALTLARSLLETGTDRCLVCMVSKDLDPAVREQLAEMYRVVEVDVMDSKDQTNLALLQRPDLGITFTKLHCWRLVDYKKCVFLDADTLVMQNIDDLFERDELSAAPDIGWPDCFNSGVFVYKPSHDTYFKLLDFAFCKGSFDGGDQGLLNSYFSEWATADIRRHLPFLYNVMASDFYFNKPALRRYGKDAKVLHFIGVKKPWMYSEVEGTFTQDEGSFSSFLNTWWAVFKRNYNSSSQAFKQLITQVQGLSLHQHLPDAARRGLWEQGCIDYTGADSFQFIQQKIESKVASKDYGGGDVAAGLKPNNQQADPSKTKSSVTVVTKARPSQ